MQEPPDGYTPATGDLSPYPMETLELGGNRWLMPNGDIRDTETGIGVGVETWTLKFWEAAAVRGGHVLSELIV